MTHWPSLVADFLPLAFAVRLGSVAISLALAAPPPLVPGAGLLRLRHRLGPHGARGPRGRARRGGAARGRAAPPCRLRLSLGYAVTPLSAWFLLVLALLAVPIAVYSVAYLGHGTLDRRSAFVGVGFNLLLGAIEAVFVADGVIGFLFAWEVMSLASAALVATEHERRDSRRAAFPLPRHVPRGDRMPGRRVLHPGLALRLLRLLRRPLRLSRRRRPRRTCCSSSSSSASGSRRA